MQNLGRTPRVAMQLTKKLTVLMRRSRRTPAMQNLGRTPHAPMQLTKKLTVLMRRSRLTPAMQNLGRTPRVAPDRAAQKPAASSRKAPPRLYCAITL